MPFAYCLATVTRFSHVTSFSQLTCRHAPLPTSSIMMVRRSARLEQARNASSQNKSPVKRSKSVEKSSSGKRAKSSACPLRKRESELEEFCIIGIDEAGRGPLAGPVVAAAAIVPHSLEGVMDSKLLTKEEERDRMYEELIASPDIRWAVAVVDAARIDEINILQATLEGMRMAASGVIEPKHGGKVCVTRKGSYVVCSPKAKNEQRSSATTKYYALIDGNRLPKDMPCEAEAIVKGDSKEYSIAAASILAKVTRDRLMRGYDELYPAFELSKHKGYPTAHHMALVRKHGASPIHRRSFAPLKHMSFDEDGRVLTDATSES